MAIKPIPDGCSRVIPYLVVPNVGKQIQFLQQVFEAIISDKTTLPDGTIMHAHVRIGDSSMMMGQMPPGQNPVTAMLYMYVADADAIYHRAIAAGASSISPMTDEFYGDRVGAVKDAAGNQWYIASRKEDLGPDEVARRAMEAMAGRRRKS